MTTTVTSDLTAVVSTRFAELEGAWNHADGAAYGEAFTVDTDFVDVRGDHHTGRAAVANGHQALFDRPYRGSVIRYHVEAAHALADGPVVAIVAATLDVPGAGPMQGTHSARATAVLVADGGAWRVRSFHNTIVQERR